MRSWRAWALAVGALLTACGVAVWWSGGGPVLFVIGIVIAVTVLLERTYGAPDGRPTGTNWRTTDERFVDPETGRLVTVWFDPATGERRYVSDDGKADRPA